MLKRTLFTALAAAGTLAFAASAQAAYLSLGTANTSNATTTLTGNTAGPELQVKNTNGSTASGFGLYGLLTAAAPTVNAAGVRGANSSTNAHGYGVWGSQAGSGTGVYGFAPSGKGMWGSSTSGTGVRGSSSSDAGVLGQHLGTSGTTPGVEGTTNSTGIGATGVLGTDPTTAYAGYGVTGTAGANFQSGVLGLGTGEVTAGVYGCADYGTDFNGNCFGGREYFYGGIGGFFIGAAQNGATDGHGVVAIGQGTSGVGILAVGPTAGSFSGNVGVTGNLNVGGTITAGVKDFKIDDPLDPAHKYLVHTSIESSQMMNVYTGNVVTNSKGFATIQMPGWFQALNRTFRYQLTVIDKAHWTARAAVWDKIAHNRFSIRTDQAHVQVSWQVTGIRHDPYANAHRTQVVVPKATADQGKYLHPELYGKPKADAIGYQKPPKAPQRQVEKR